jgi:hypothetical protein
VEHHRSAHLVGVPHSSCPSSPPRAPPPSSAPTPAFAQNLPRRAHRGCDVADRTTMQLDSRPGFERVAPPPPSSRGPSTCRECLIHSCGAAPSGRCMPPSEQDVWSSRRCRCVSLVERIEAMVRGAWSAPVRVRVWVRAGTWWRLGIDV